MPLRGKLKTWLWNNKENPNYKPQRDLKYIQKSEDRDMKELEKDKQRIKEIHQLMELMYCKSGTQKSINIIEKYLKHKEDNNGNSKKSTNVS